MESEYKEFKTYKDLIDFVDRIIKKKVEVLILCSTLEKISKIDDIEYNIAIIDQKYLDRVDEYKIKDKLYIVSVIDMPTESMDVKDTYKSELQEKSEDIVDEEFQQTMSDIISDYTETIINTEGNIEGIIEALTSMYLDVYSYSYFQTKIDVANQLTQDVIDESKEIYEDDDKNDK
jgi:hypothetical protein